MKVVGYIALQYMVTGTVFMLFYLVLSRKPTIRGVLRECFWWPHRVFKGARAIYQSAGKADLDG